MQVQLTEQSQIQPSTVGTGIQTPSTSPVPVGDQTVSYFDIPLTVRVKVENEEEGGFSAQCVEYPAAISEGDTIEEVLKNIFEAISLVLEESPPKLLAVIAEYRT